MDCYEVGILAERMGVVSAGNMTLEALLAKFMLALGQCKEPSEIRSFLRDNRYGEVI
jgi:L-asparaginase